MAIAYAWSFPRFDCVRSANGLTDIVKMIHWRIIGVDGQYTASSYGCVALSDPDPNGFVPYDRITEQWAIDAVVNSEGFDLDEIKAGIEGNIFLQANPPMLAMKPPFSE